MSVCRAGGAYGGGYGHAPIHGGYGAPVHGAYGAPGYGPHPGAYGAPHGAYYLEADTASDAALPYGGAPFVLLSALGVAAFGSIVRAASAPARVLM